MAIKKKVYISMPMNDRTHAQIETLKRQYLAHVANLFLEFADLFDFVLIDGDSILDTKDFNKIDIMYFAEGWQDDPACVLEHDACIQYDILYITDKEKKNEQETA